MHTFTHTGTQVNWWASTTPIMAAKVGSSYVEGLWTRSGPEGSSHSSQFVCECAVDPNRHQFDIRSKMLSKHPWASSAQEQPPRGSLGPRAGTRRSGSRVFRKGGRIRQAVAAIAGRSADQRIL